MYPSLPSDNKLESLVYKICSLCNMSCSNLIIKNSNSLDFTLKLIIKIEHEIKKHEHLITTLHQEIINNNKLNSEDVKTFLYLRRHFLSILRNMADHGIEISLSINYQQDICKFLQTKKAIHEGKFRYNRLLKHCIPYLSIYDYNTKHYLFCKDLHNDSIIGNNRSFIKNNIDVMRNELDIISFTCGKLVIEKDKDNDLIEKQNFTHAMYHTLKVLDADIKYIYKSRILRNASIVLLTIFICSTSILSYLYISYDAKKVVLHAFALSSLILLSVLIALPIYYITIERHQRKKSLDGIKEYLKDNEKDLTPLSDLINDHEPSETISFNTTTSFDATISPDTTSLDTTIPLDVASTTAVKSLAAEALTTAETSLAAEALTTAETSLATISTATTTSPTVTTFPAATTSPTTTSTATITAPTNTSTATTTISRLL